MEKLASLGGTPVRNTPLFYGHQFIDDDDIQSVVNVLKSDYLTCGPEIEYVEQKLCEITQANYAVVMSNGTAALHAACFAANIQPGDEIITTPITFAASANCILYCGAKAVFADIELDTYNISPTAIEKCITDKTKAIIAVDFTGQAVKINDIKAICDQYNLLFIEDAAHSIGTRYQGKSIGSLADMTTFSFHPVKTVTAGEGGAVTTNDPKQYEQLKLFRAHGITREAPLMQANPQPWWYEQIDLGYNYRMSDMQAALLSSQLNKLPRFSKRRKEISAYYNQQFSAVPSIIPQVNIPESDTTPHLYVLHLDLNQLNTSRDEIFHALWAENICSNVHYIPVYTHPYYKRLGYPSNLCPNAEQLFSSIVSLPLYYGLSDQDVDDVVHAVKKVLAYYAL